MTTNDVSMFNVVTLWYIIKIMSKNILTHRYRDAFGVCYYYNVAKGEVSSSDPGHPWHRRNRDEELEEGGLVLGGGHIVSSDPDTRVAKESQAWLVETWEGSRRRVRWAGKSWALWEKFGYFGRTLSKLWFLVLHSPSTLSTSKNIWRVGPAWGVWWTQFE
jgi:hypothetical protein